MPTFTIRGVPVTFPFEPYEIQKDYMEKVIECFQTQSNGVLESPTGTGKTLSLLCSSLAWLSLKKAEFQARARVPDVENENEFMWSLNQKLKDATTASGGMAEGAGKAFMQCPTIIYSSRTHSQLSQAMQELKSTAYAGMRAIVMGSREQLCIHPEVMEQEGMSAKIYLCQMKVKSKQCMFYNRVEKKSQDPDILSQTVMDIEDLMTLGKTHKFCPLYMVRQLKGIADIVFMPYNYLLQPRTWKALGIDISNSYVIIDEAHNIEKICEESASLTIKSTDIALCIDEVTFVMTGLSENLSFTETPKDISAEELMQLKEMLLNFEKIFDEIEIGDESKTYDGDYLLEILEKAGINLQSYHALVYWIEKAVQFLTVAQQSAMTTRKGSGLEAFADLLIVAFMETSVEFKEKIKKCYKVHFMYEEPKKKKAGSAWLDAPASTKRCRVMNYWCFNPGFGMGMLIKKGVKSIILTSGTLAPLPALIKELDLTVKVTLENPHIVRDNQVCIKILPYGPDGELLECSYKNRDNPKYIHSLGRSILNLSIIIPGGLLVFFSSYPIMQKCQEQWEQDGTWSLINQKKPIFVEPKSKQAFTNAMTEYYKRINDPVYKAAIFMGVCRGKVAEGLDFTDLNGRAVIITGLPYPPLKDPKIILKRKYLDICCASNKQYLNGQEWYSLEAVRAVNQAMGRVIRHKNDYGAILLLDSRFSSSSIKQNVSKWLRNKIGYANNFGQILPMLKKFFKEAQTILPDGSNKIKLIDRDVSCKNKLDCDVKSTINNSEASGSSGLVNIQHNGVQSSSFKRRKVTLVTEINKPTLNLKQEDCKEYLAMAKKTLGEVSYKKFCSALHGYRNEGFKVLTDHLDDIYKTNRSLQILMPGLRSYIKDEDKNSFELFWKKLM